MEENLDLKSNRQEESTNLKDAQTSALCAASAIIAFSIVYWALQIQSVRELLDLAYGF